MFDLVGHSPSFTYPQPDREPYSEDLPVKTKIHCRAFLSKFSSGSSAVESNDSWYERAADVMVMISETAASSDHRLLAKAQHEGHGFPSIGFSHPLRIYPNKWFLFMFTYIFSTFHAYYILLHSCSLCAILLLMETQKIFGGEKCMCTFIFRRCIVTWLCSGWMECKFRRNQS